MSERRAPSPIPAAMAADARRAQSTSPAGYGVFRPHQGPAGTWHWGLDVPRDAASDGAVDAPEAMTVRYVWRDNATPPWVGYGPAGVVGEGESGLFHLLGHLDPASLAVAVGAHLEVGALVGHASKTVGHCHWEVRTRAVDDGPATRAAYTVNPVLWLDGTTRPLAGAPSVPWYWWALGLYLLSR